MNNKQRRNIIDEVNRRMKVDFQSIVDVQSGEFETIQDGYIDLVCNEHGWSLTDFYAGDGKMLADLLDM